jgi:phosphate transport system protein
MNQSSIHHKVHESSWAELMVVAGRSLDGLESDLQELVRVTAEMGGLVENQIAEALEALTRRDNERASRLLASDTAVDATHRIIEERAVETIASRRPGTRDLRYVIGILRIANELERIGDLAKNISKRVIAITGDEMPRPAMQGINHMATLMLTQLCDVLDGFAGRDIRYAMDVWTRDQELDRLCTSLFREILKGMVERRTIIAAGVHLLFCVKNLERMGDHTTNIAELVHYMFTGDSLPADRPKADGSSGLTLETIGVL